MTLIVQVDGKVRDKIEVPVDTDEDDALELARRIGAGATGDRRQVDREGDRPRPEARELRHGALTSPRRARRARVSNVTAPVVARP